MDVFIKRVTKSFELMDVFIKRVTKSFERMDVFIKRVTKSFEQMDIFFKRVAKPFERLDVSNGCKFFQTASKRLANGIPFENRKSLVYVFP